MNIETKIRLMERYKRLPVIKELLQIRDGYYKSIPKSSLRQFEIHITEHCNLNCKGCDNFSCIAEPECIDVDWFKTQMDRMGVLFNGYVGNINLMGGEPLLHPEVEKIIQITRWYFPYVEINILTNGIKLLSMPDTFYEVCKDNDVIISITKYPPVDYSKIENKLNSVEVKWNYFNPDPNHNIYKTPIDLAGKCDGTRMFYSCFRAAHCVQLRNGKIYPCSVAPNMRHFIKQFDLKSVVEVQEDSIDIFTHKRKDILEFLSRPIPMCRFCNIDGFQTGIPFGKTEKKIEEWV